ncbi:MAG TPA: DUF3011 domain-containing protein [Thermoanaerobaculia bacterium]
MTCAVLLFAAGAAGQQVVLCESPNNVYRECRIGSAGKVKLVFERSDRRCYEGVSWGTRSDGIVWVDRGCSATFAVDARTVNTVVCESQNGKMQVCKADTSRGVAVHRQLSRTDCEEKLNWGWDEVRGEIWVDDGCRAEFFLGLQLESRPGRETLDALVTCESADGRRKECAADTSGGVQLVGQVGDADCSFNTSWGYDAKGIWVNKGCRADFAVRGKPKQQVKALVCESTGARKACPAETQFGIALVKQLGEGACILGETWGFDQDGVWVEKGCRAQFALGGYRLPETAVPATAMRLTCESLDGKRNVCAVDTGRGVGLVKQLSEATCVLNRTWGYDREGIWVAEGCRAEFVVAR